MVPAAVRLQTSGGAREDGVVVGNAYDKYGSKNPVTRRLMAGFESSLSQLVDRAAPESIHEVGCGEGYWVLRWNQAGLAARGTDFSEQVIAIARENAARQQLPPTLFEARSIYELDPNRDAADLVVCCEVLEHLASPEAGLRALQRVTRQHLVLSVPREPLWRALNLVRGKYLRAGGNTPGHLQHWPRAGFLRLVADYFEAVEVRTPLPWTMALCRPRR